MFMNSFDGCDDLKTDDESFIHASLHAEWGDFKIYLKNLSTDSIPGPIWAK